MTTLTKLAAISTIALSACLIPSAVNATYGATYGINNDLSIAVQASGEVLEARKAYMARRGAEAKRESVQNQQTRKALMTMMVALQASCDAACIDA